MPPLEQGAPPDPLRLTVASRPRSPHAHLVKAPEGALLLVPNGTRLFDVDAATAAILERALAGGDGAVEAELERLGVHAPPFVDDRAPAAPPVRALSLAVAQTCNLSCTYCYAQQGEFGGKAKNMTAEVATEAVELLLSEVQPGETVNLAFLGGEPLVNRAVLRATTELAARLAAERGVKATFSITTNGTLVTEDDGAFFEKHGFAVTVSVDGLRESHNRLRTFRDGRGSFDVVLGRVRPLLAMQRRMQVSARVTVTSQNLALQPVLEELVGMGFHGVGFSPMLRSPTGSGEIDAAGLEAMLGAMVACGAVFEEHLRRGERYPFTNLVQAMRELHRGTHRPYACGAGAGYLGVSADGELAACHRFVGDDAGRMGLVRLGVDRARQAQWLHERHVHRQEPCRDCWARYLCGGGCHHEVIARGRPACDYIRGWLHYCLEAYGRLSRVAPWYFESPSRPSPVAAGLVT